MKKILVASCLFVCLLVTASFISSKSFEEIWLRGLVENVKANDLNKFKASVITEAEFAILIQNSTWSDEKKASMKKRMTQAFLDEKSKESFNAISATVNDNKILWSKTLVDSVTFKVREIEGMKEMIFRVYLSQGNRRYELSGDKCLKVPSGWKLSSGVNLTVKKSGK